MPSQVVRLDDRGVEILREVVRREISRSQAVQPQRPNAYGGGYISHFVGIASSQITARSGTTPGSGTVTLYYRDRDTNTLTAVGNSDVTAYNVSQSAVANAAYVTVLQDNYGDYWVILEDCG